MLGFETPAGAFLKHPPHCSRPLLAMVDVRDQSLGILSADLQHHLLVLAAGSDVGEGAIKIHSALGPARSHSQDRMPIAWYFQSAGIAHGPLRSAQAE